MNPFSSDPYSSALESFPLRVLLNGQDLGTGDITFHPRWKGNAILDVSFFCPSCRKLWARLVADPHILEGRAITRRCYACGNGSLSHPFSAQYLLPPRALRREFLIAEEASQRNYFLASAGGRIHDSLFRYDVEDAAGYWAAGGANATGPVP